MACSVHQIVPRRTAGCARSFMSSPTNAEASKLRLSSSSLVIEAQARSGASERDDGDGHEHDAAKDLEGQPLPPFGKIFTVSHRQAVPNIAAGNRHNNVPARIAIVLPIRPREDGRPATEPSGASTLMSTPRSAHPMGAPVESMGKLSMTSWVSVSMITTDCRGHAGSAITV